MQIKSLTRFTAICLFAPFLFSTNYTMAQNALNTSLGDYKGMKTSGQVIDVSCSNAEVQLTVYSANIIRIRINKNKFADDFSYAMVGKPKASASFTTQNNDNSVSVQTDSIKLTINKKPMRFSFSTLDGKIIYEDEPAFGTSWISDEITTYKKMQNGERFIGLGEKTGGLDRRGNGYTNWNTDCFGYGPDTDPLYVSIPFYIGIHDGLNYGIFMDNSSKSNFNFGASNNRFSSFTAEYGDMNYYFIYHTHVAGIIESYTYLTGRTPMPSQWSIGFQQCRYSYYPDKEVLNVAHTFREKKIPLDVIYLDIHYMDSYKIFTWHPTRFPQPKKMLDELKSMGIKTTVIVDPGIKVEKGYKSYEEGLKQDLFLKYPDGTNYTGEVWPGWCHFPDFTNPRARDWWGKSFGGYVNDGIEGFWNDMNEPATWGQKFPALVEFNYDNHRATTMQSRNVFGMQMARSTYEGTKKLLGGKRPFVLTRAGYAGIQRYSAVWTGDNSPYDDHMLLGVRLVNSLGLSGVANAGYDVGGFAGDASPALFARWISLGAFSPFFRSHKMINAKESQPWSYGEEVEEIAKNYIQLRYNLMPHLYSSFYEATQNGMPVARTLAIDYTYDAKIYDGTYQNQYFFGNGIMVAPFASNVNLGKVYLPQGNWYDFYNDKTFTGAQEIVVETPVNRLPLFVKGGSIIAMQSPVQSFKELPLDTMYIHVYYGENNNAMMYYEDDGETYSNETGDFYKRNMVYDAGKKEFSLYDVEGSHTSKFKNLKIIFHHFSGIANSVNVDGVATSVKSEYFSFLNPISKFDPIGNEGRKDAVQGKTVVVKNKNGKIKISW